MNATARGWRQALVGLVVGLLLGWGLGRLSRDSLEKPLAMELVLVTVLCLTAAELVHRLEQAHDGFLRRTEEIGRRLEELAVRPPEPTARHPSRELPEPAALAAPPDSSPPPSPPPRGGAAASPAVFSPSPRPEPPSSSPPGREGLRPLTPGVAVELWNLFLREGNGLFLAPGLERLITRLGVSARAVEGSALGLSDRVLGLEPQDGSGKVLLLPSFRHAPRAVSEWFDAPATGNRQALIRRLLRPALARRGESGLQLFQRGRVE